tara:strand:+ start:1972 stop:2988 length:1017 start_codon:yes stop_codon:yes gene_type:complete
METQKMKIAIVILNWNGKELLELFLPKLIKFSDESKVFVVDNNSTDNSIEFLNTHYSNIDVIKNKSNLGYAQGYNVALQKIKADYYVLINSDIEVTKDWLKPLINIMDSDTQIAACQPKVLSFNDSKYFEYAGASGGFIDILGYPFCRGRIFNHLERDSLQYNDSIEIFWATGACLFIRSSSFWEVGGFDNDFFAHQEEIDLCWRLKNKSYKIMVEPKSKVLHVGGATLEKSSPKKTYLNFRNNLYMLFKNLKLIQLLFIIPIRLILDGIAAFTFLFKRNGLLHFLSIIKAHLKFYQNINKLIKKRIHITQKTHHSGKINNSILFLNKIKKKNNFSDL